MKSHSSNLGVGDMMKGKADPCIPHLLQSHVLQTLLGGGMVPARKIRVAVTVLRGSSDLDPCHAPATGAKLGKVQNYVLRESSNHDPGHAPAALELVVGVAGGALLQLEQVPQVREGEVTLHILLLWQIIIE